MIGPDWKTFPTLVPSQRQERKGMIISEDVITEMRREAHSLDGLEGGRLKILDSHLTQSIKL